MQIITSPEELQRLCLDWRCGGVKTALVPTMGYYHAGHESLMAYARERADKVVVSLFVNPAQFAPGEDLAAYPRDLSGDAEVAQRAGADVLFTPQPEAMYPQGFDTWVEIPGLSSGLCGADRPGHFRGVCTVVMKLMLLTLPRLAVFGEKDWQQLAVLRRMAKDMHLPVTIDGCPIVRETDGLAMSSRNVYLTPEERRQAPALYQGLIRARDMVAGGERDTAVLRAAVKEYWKQHLPEGREDYLEIVHPDTLQPLERVGGMATCAAAVRLGRARLIDNLALI
ncbi:pantoate/beta-alanine ligase [Oleidesulfovibrio alaskensis G20]|jgi:pantoate--beta-alanine ligase|uniref:Pantothenate synthetase n=1 Tax=Oleidesulfovibrio alaskensis (strain ATCC BAA-1058 / DSM 17464 / G20) TaxID=207559 RepID=PANC_OLEA2|nr:pantoate--beta-alanine ligase [Oleidesulfovibrio alaskensis]Q311U9.1 RecName: Full=Pantothenate synthetase; Short=PS; AltName: Full=Pantoate--beta-alanine ligase; AltName: Full=Pantoate-activating enzyme [Oleidesulfovibrio alaskensis G20]ABB38297.1 pantoate/beta-alanine ligase [Oleidesulfovibrio alaskensis G20]MBG0774225.1 pantoate--beta-alanine ligase [Oleidesulfovibrio alaskensis]MBL3581234.1 pantoate--beta-alanine ligase [Oleidesulfovibrio alaskensis]